MEKTIFTPGNINNFFTTDTANLPGNVSAIVKTLGLGYGQAAKAVFEGAAGRPELIEPVLSGMVGSYSHSVQLITKGWAGHA